MVPLPGAACLQELSQPFAWAPAPNDAAISRHTTQAGRPPGPGNAKYNYNYAAACAQMTPTPTRHSELTATRGFDGGYTTLFWAEARPRQYSGVVAPPARDHIASQALPRWRSHEPKPTTGMAALGWMQRAPPLASLHQEF